MLKQITEGIWIHQSAFLQSNAVAVQGQTGVLLIDPGITSDEMAALAKDLRDLNLSVVAGYSTHPHWDHVLWHAQFGEAPRYGTARNEAEIKRFLSNDHWKAQLAPMLPADIADQIPTDDLFGDIMGLPAGTGYVPWDGPKVKIVEHAGHAFGSAALLVEASGVLVAGDLLSDILVPFLELDAEDPIADYLAALQLCENETPMIGYVVPGHGSVGNATEIKSRIEQDRAYIKALSHGGGSDDKRLTSGPQKELLASVHAWQKQQIAEKYDAGRSR